MSATGPGDDAPASKPWATVRVTLPEGPREPDALASEADRLAAIGTFVADAPNVGGAEYRDPSTLGGATRPELWIYTLPEALDDVQALTQQWADQLGLSVRLRAQVRHDDDWRDSWKQFYRPLYFGEGDSALLVRPSWIEATAEDPPRQLVLDPGRAFGTGLHESTRLCLARLCALHGLGAAPKTVLDLGCGSGILALAAARLWPRAHVSAMDVDPEATATTADNAADNGLSDRLTIATGELSALAPRPFDLLIANIRPSVLVPLAPATLAYTHAAGRALLSGVLTEERNEVAAAWVAAGWSDPRAEAPGLVDGGWCALDLDGPA